MISFLSGVDEPKKARILKMQRNEDRIRSLLADRMVRYLAMQELGIDSKDIVFEYNFRGKPMLKGIQDFCFNISHSGEYVACAISEANVGCDIQQVIPCDISMGKLVFTPQELALIHGIDDFYQMWTRKEALLKAIGIGISEEGIGLSMVKDGKISPVEYDKKKYYCHDFVNWIDGYTLGIWSCDKVADVSIYEIDYPMRGIHIL